MLTGKRSNRCVRSQRIGTSKTRELRGKPQAKKVRSHIPWNGYHGGFEKETRGTNNHCGKAEKFKSSLVPQERDELTVGKRGERIKRKQNAKALIKRGYGGYRKGRCSGSRESLALCFKRKKRLD